MTFSDKIRTFLSHDHYCTVATIDPDGGPRQATIWYTLEGDSIIINSLAGRRWPSNLVRDPRISVAVTDGSDGYRWVGLTGTAAPITDAVTAQGDIAAMARRYHKREPEVLPAMLARFESQERISFRVHVLAVHDHLS